MHFDTNIAERSNINVMVIYREQENDKKSTQQVHHIFGLAYLQNKSNNQYIAADHGFAITVTH